MPSWSFMDLGAATPPAAPDNAAPARDGAPAPAPAARHTVVLSLLMEAGLRMALGIEEEYAEVRAAARPADPSADPSEEAEGDETPAATPACRPARRGPGLGITGELALAFSRASRAVRMTIALQERLAQERRAAGQGADGAERPPQTLRVVFVDPANPATGTPERVREYGSPPPAQPTPQGPSLHDRKAEVGRIVAGVAQAGLQPGEHSKREAAEVVERLRREARERLEEEHLLDAVMNRPVSEVIELICRELGLAPNWPSLAEEAWAQAEMAGPTVGAPLAEFRPEAWGKPASPPMRPPDKWPHPRPSTGSG